MTLREGPSMLPDRLQGQFRTGSQDTAATRDQNVLLQFVRIRYRMARLWKTIRAEGPREPGGDCDSLEFELEPEDQWVWHSILASQMLYLQL